MISGYGSRYHDGVDDTDRFVEYLPLKPIHREIEPEEKFYYCNQLKGMFHPLSKMKKDLIDTGRPYYSREKIFKDAAQLLYGFKNLFDGLFTFLIGILVFSIFAPISLLFICATFPLVIECTIKSFSWVLEGLLNMIRGITQIITAPLTYCFKLPLRMLLTRCSINHLLLAEEKPEIQRLAKSARQYLTKIKPVEEKLIPLFNQKKAFVNKEEKKAVLEKKHKEVMPVIEGLLEGVEKALGERRNERRYLPADFHDRMIAEGRHFRESVYIPMRMIYEVHRKYEKSIRRGWDSSQPRAEVKNLFHRCFSVFTESIANNELRYN